jgi:hypothetical protein
MRSLVSLFYVASLEMNEETHWGQGCNLPTKGCSAEEGPISDLLTFKTRRVNHEIVIIGDSHARNSAAELQHCLDSNFAVSSFVKPGAGMRAIVGTVEKDIKKLRSDDVVVIWGGSNDIGRNN